MPYIDKEDIRRAAEFRRNINDLKNNFISFPDPNHHKDQNYDLESIKITLFVTHDWMCALVTNNESILRK